MNQQIEVGIIGEYDPGRSYQIATIEALDHAADALSVPLKSSWISTQSLSNGSFENTLKPFHGLWVPGDCKSTDGALKAIQFAREQGWPFQLFGRQAKERYEKPPVPLNGRYHRNWALPRKRKDLPDLQYRLGHTR